MEENQQPSCHEKTMLNSKFFLKLGHSRPLFLYFCLFNYKLVDKFLLMTGCEPRISGVGSNRSSNGATTTAQLNTKLTS